MEFFSECIRINNIPKYAGVQWDLLKLLQQAGDRIGRVASLIVPWEAKTANYGKTTEERDTVAYVQLEDAAKHEELFRLFDNVIFETSNSNQPSRRMHCKFMDFIPQRFHEVRVNYGPEYHQPYNEQKYRLERYDVITDRDELVVRMQALKLDSSEVGIQVEPCNTDVGIQVTSTSSEASTQTEEESKGGGEIKCSASCKQLRAVSELKILKCGHVCCTTCQSGRSFPVGAAIFVVCGACGDSSIPRGLLVI